MPVGAEAAFTAIDGYEESLSLEELTSRGAFLACWINGEPLPLEYDHPLRLVAPGFNGHDWVKWLVHSEVLGEWTKRTVVQSLSRRYEAQPRLGRRTTPDG